MEKTALRRAPSPVPLRKGGPAYGRSEDLGKALNAKKIWSEECNYLNQPDPVKGVDSPQKKCGGEACENYNLARRPGITNVPLDEHVVD